MEPRSARTDPHSRADSKCKNLHHDLCINRHNISLKIEYSSHLCQGPSGFKPKQTILQKSSSLEKNVFHTTEWEFKKKEKKKENWMLSWKYRVPESKIEWKCVPQLRQPLSVTHFMVYNHSQVNIIKKVLLSPQSPFPPGTLLYLHEQFSEEPYRTEFAVHIWTAPTPGMGSNPWLSSLSLWSCSSFPLLQGHRRR